MTNPATKGEVDAVRQVALNWTTAVERKSLDALARLMTDDIVVVHGNGRTLSGREAVLADFACSFQKCDVSQRVDFEETIIAQGWALGRARVHTTVRLRPEGVTREFDSHTFTVLKRGASGAWYVARSMGVVEQQS